MIEFNLTVCCDTQDPELAYNELRQALQFTGLRVYVHGNWLRNHKPMPAHDAMAVARKWQETRDPFTVDFSVQFESNDPAFNTYMKKLCEAQQMNSLSWADEDRKEVMKLLGDDDES